MSVLNCAATKCDKETPVEPGCYRLEDIQQKSIVPHVTSAISPSVYSETPHDDLVAELAKMKVMMEQMRLDKERLEMDAKRYEMEAKRKEEEEAAALRKIQEQELAAKEKKELDAVFSLFRDSLHQYSRDESNMDYVWKRAGEKESAFLKSLEASGETILCVQLDTNMLRCSNTPGKGLLKFVITNCHVYQCTYTAFVKTNSTSICGTCPPTRRCQTTYTDIPNPLRETCISLKTGTFYASTLYSFTNPLNLVHAKILSSIMTKPIEVRADHHPNQTLWYRVIGALGERQMISYQTPLSDALKKFESIIRLIPGSYKNGNWRQLDGFFGMYFNEETMEVSEVPPPL
jgi:hypothetical protein